MVIEASLNANFVSERVLAFQGQVSTVFGWLHALPGALVHAHPFLCLYYSSFLALTNQLQAAEELLRAVERQIQEEASAWQVQTISGWVHYIRVIIARFSGDLTHTISFARQALALLPEAEVIPRAAAIPLVAYAYQISGDVTLATEHEVVAVNALIRTSGNPFVIVGSMTLLAHLYVLQSRLRPAEATYAQVVQVVPRPEVLQTMLTSLFYYFGLGDLLRERNELEAAERYLAQGMALVKEALTVAPFVAMLGYTAFARLQQARGNSRETFATLHGLAQMAERRHFPPHLLTQVAAVRAQIEMAQGHLAAAIRWADASGLSTNDDDLSYPREGEYLTLARVRIAQRRDHPEGPFLQDVLHLLDRLLKDAEAKARLVSVLEILVLRALALEAQGNRTSALSTLEHALVLAAPEGYIRLFVDEGTPMLALLRQAHARSRVPGYVATLLSAFVEQPLSDLPLPSARLSSIGFLDESAW